MVQRTRLAKIINILSPIDKITFLYAVSTALWILFFYSKIDQAGLLLINRFVILIAVTGIAIWHKNRPSLFSDISRHLYGIVLLSYWYGETYQLNRVLFIPFDEIFYHIDQLIFGFQPSIEFCKALPARWVSEILNVGYFSYFFLNLATFAIVFIKKREDAIKSVFIVLTSFFIYYWIFILFPVVGPQFWLPEALRNAQDGYIFQKGVVLVQQIGEQPTGAFPSSHVGMTMIFLFITRKYSKKAFNIMVPIALLLIFSTVYIKAHYAIDVAAGLITCIPIYWISKYLFIHLNNKDITIHQN